MRSFRWPITLLAVSLFFFMTPTRQQSLKACNGGVFPHTWHCDYYQLHCIGGGGIGDCYWSLDGFCDIDCDGNQYCEGDTRYIQGMTTLDCQDSGPCCPE